MVSQMQFRSQLSKLGAVSPRLRAVATVAWLAVVAACSGGGTSSSPPPAQSTLALSAATFSVAQNAGPVTITVHRLAGASGAVSVGYATSDGTAVAGTDYTAANGTLSWADGDTTDKSVAVAVSNAAPFAGTKTFTVTLSGATGNATVGSPSVATVSIAGSGGSPGTLALSTATYAVGQGAGSVTITVNRTGGTSGAASVAYATSDGSAMAGTDYTNTHGSLAWADGDAAPKTFTVAVSNAAPFTGTRSFNVTLSAATVASLGTPAGAVVSITGDGTVAAPGTLALSSATYTVAQAGGSVTISVNRAAGSAGAVSVSYATSNGTALAGTDYTAATGTLSWPDGDSTVKTFTVAVSNATPFSGTKTFAITLSAVTGGATLGSPATATATINGSGGSAGTLALSAAAYTVAQAGGSVTVTVNRTAGTTGPVSVSYATSNGTATAGSDYTSTSGTLSWASGDGSAKTFAVPVSNATPFAGSRNFNVGLSAATGGATLGSPSAATVTINGSTAAALSIRVSGNHLVDGSGNVVQLRGVNVSGLETVAVNQYSPANPWAWGNSGTPNWTTIKTWGVVGGPAVVNAVRLPLNEASWLQQTCTDTSGEINGVVGQQLPADPGGNYRATVAQSVSDATAAGLYVILDLHWSAPNVSANHPACPTAQNAMADQDNSIAFWSSVATAFKGSPNVIFELFNEPYLDSSTLVDNTPWQDLLSGGGTLAGFLTGGGAITTGPYAVNWKNAGMQQLLNAVRATGAKNVVLTAPLNYASSMDQWLAYRPTDTISPSQIGAVWHAYNSAGDPGGTPTSVTCYDPYASPALTLPTCSAIIMADVQQIAATFPVVITEFGDTITANPGVSAPWASILLPFADTNGLSYLGWTWNPWQGYNSDVLITDDNGTPTNGYGQYVQQHYKCVAAGTKNCP